MRLENILREKIYTFSAEPQISEVEGKILQEISNKENLGQIAVSLILDSNDDYDSYKILTNKGSFCVKVSLDEKNKNLARDYSVMEQVMQKICPYGISIGELKSFGAEYSISSLLPAKSAYELGKSIISQKKEQFANSITHLSKQEVFSRPFYQFLREKYLDSSLKGAPHFKDLDFSKDQEILEVCTAELSATKDLIQKLYSKDLEGGSFCHGRLTPSRVLFKDDFHFINFEDSYVGNLLVDLCGLKYDFFIHDSVESSIINLCRKEVDLKPENYRRAANIVKAMKFHDLISDFVKQVYIYRGVRQKKILELTERMSRSFGLFSGLEPFERHKDKIARMFTSSVL